MIHGILAGFLVSSAIIALCVEALKSEAPHLSRQFTGLYLLGTIFWGLVAVAANTLPVLVISAVQFSSCLFLLCYCKSTEGSK